MTKQSIIQLNHICAAYERKKVLEDINLTVYEKDFLGVIGPNGGGKTTLIKIILGLLHPISGDIRFYHEGKEVQEISPNLRYVIDELDQICQRDRTEVDLKRKILDDLRHLESVVTNKISEIEADLEKLTRK